MQNEAGEHEVYKDSIFRIPGLLKMPNEEAYMPDKFSIGPWHIGKTQLLRTGQILKESFLEGFMNRFGDRAAAESVLGEAITKVCDNARKCYEGGVVYDMGENMDVGKEDFKRILLLDGCFIIELFFKNAERTRKDKVHPRIPEFLIFSEGMIQVIYHDLLLLENQIPWFVLECLYKCLLDKVRWTGPPLTVMAIQFFNPICHCGSLDLSGDDSNILHLVDFMWRFFCSPSTTVKFSTTSEYRTLISSATKLKRAGVKFLKAESRTVRFFEGSLEIPPLLITSSTETIFINLIIFEQCSFPCVPLVAGYVSLLDCLVDTSDDVDLMCRTKILNNWLNPKETINFLKRVNNISPIKHYFLYSQLCEDVNKYCGKR